MAGIHFFSVALHEIGHSLGLAHSYEREAVMYPNYVKQHHGLKQDDINGIEKLYRKWTFSCCSSLKNGPLHFKGILEISISMSLAYRYIYFAYSSVFLYFIKYLIMVTIVSYVAVLSIIFKVIPCWDYQPLHK